MPTLAQTSRQIWKRLTRKLVDVSKGKLRLPRRAQAVLVYTTIGVELSKSKANNKKQETPTNFFIGDKLKTFIRQKSKEYCMLQE